MRTRTNKLTPTWSNGRFLASFALVLFCLIKMERYIAVSSGPAVQQNITTEQIEPFQPNYSIPDLVEQSDAPAAVQPAPASNETLFFGRRFSLFEHDYSISVKLIRHACAEPVPDFFGYLHLRHCRTSPDDAAVSPAII